jgi:hypothetical protein
MKKTQWGKQLAQIGARARTKHGMWRTRTYRAWRNARMRVRDKQRKRYGGRGITMCPEWTESFTAFLKDMGPAPSDDHQLDRRNNDDGYCKSNCRWVTRFEQNRNTSQNHFIHFGNVKLCITDWANAFGVSHHTLRKRLKAGWSFFDAVLIPVGKYNFFL